jgi:hypothetical protein
MHEQRATRRPIIATLVVLTAAITLGAGYEARAADDGPYRRPDFNSREEFRSMCQLEGGTFFADLSRIACYIPGFGWIDCDNDGKDCWVTPESWQQPRPPGVGNEYDGSIDEVAPGDQPSVAAPADDQQPKAKAKHGKETKGKHGKKHRHGGKRRT